MLLRWLRRHGCPRDHPEPPKHPYCGLRLTLRSVIYLQVQRPLRWVCFSADDVSRVRYWDEKVRLPMTDLCGMPTCCEMGSAPDHSDL